MMPSTMPMRIIVVSLERSMAPSHRDATRQQGDDTPERRHAPTIDALGVRPSLQAEHDRQHAREEGAGDGDDHADPYFLRLQPSGLPRQEQRKGEPPSDRDLRVEL